MINTATLFNSLSLSHVSVSLYSLLCLEGKKERKERKEWNLQNFNVCEERGKTGATFKITKKEARKENAIMHLLGIDGESVRN
jgi:hypothetical protein